MFCEAFSVAAYYYTVQVFPAVLLFCVFQKNEVVKKFAILYKKVTKVRNLTLYTGIKRGVSNE